MYLRRETFGRRARKDLSEEVVLEEERELAMETTGWGGVGWG